MYDVKQIINTQTYKFSVWNNENILQKCYKSSLQINYCTLKHTIFFVTVFSHWNTQPSVFSPLCATWLIAGLILLHSVSLINCQMEKYWTINRIISCWAMHDITIPETSASGLCHLSNIMFKVCVYFVPNLKKIVLWKLLLSLLIFST